MMLGPPVVGDDAGDELPPLERARALGSTLSETARLSDAIGRIGEGEFVDTVDPGVCALVACQS